MRPVYVITAAYDAEEVLKNGQETFAMLAATAGAQGVEVRRELLAEQHMTLQALNEVLQTEGLQVAYSAAVNIWSESGELNREALSKLIDEASEVGAIYVKVCLGGYDPVHSDLPALKQIVQEFASKGIHLTLENDQSASGGTIKPLLEFLETASNADIELKMTFDLGNWLWTGESMEEAAKVFAPYTVYIHVKYGLVESGLRRPAVLPLQKDVDWKRAMQYFQDDIPVAIEFPIRSENLVQATASWITLLQSC